MHWYRHRPRGHRILVNTGTALFSHRKTPGYSLAYALNTTSIVLIKDSWGERKVRRVAATEGWRRTSMSKVSEPSFQVVWPCKVVESEVILQLSTDSLKASRRSPVVDKNFDLPRPSCMDEQNHTVRYSLLFLIIYSCFWFEFRQGKLPLENTTNPNGQLVRELDKWLRLRVTVRPRTGISP